MVDIKQSVQAEVNRVKNMSTDAARSGAYLYPIKGVLYFVTHRDLWKPLLSKLLPIIGLSIGVIVFMFAFTYFPQAAILAIVNGPLAILTTVLLVLSESSTIINILSRSFILQDALVDTFDGTLLSQNDTKLVSSGRQIKPGSDAISKLGKLIKSPFQRFSPERLITYLLYLPLNFIPVVGTVIFIFLQGRKYGPAAHTRYFQLKGFSKDEKEAFVEGKRGPYTGFGTAATLLEMIPVVGIAFTFTNTVAAALWAADLERGVQDPRDEGSAGGSQNELATGLRERVRNAQGGN